MTSAVLQLAEQSLRTALVLSMPLILGVGLVGVLMGLLQTIVQVQDQNVSFAPKFLAIVVLLAIGGPIGLAILQSLLLQVMLLLPALALQSK